MKIFDNLLTCCCNPPKAMPADLSTLVALCELALEERADAQKQMSFDKVNLIFVLAL